MYPPVFPRGVLYFVCRPTRRVALRFERAMARRAKPALLTSWTGGNHFHANRRLRVPETGFLGGLLCLGGTLLGRCCGGDFATTSTARSKRVHALLLEIICCRVFGFLRHAKNETGAIEATLVQIGRDRNNDGIY